MAEDAPRDSNFVPAALFQIDGSARGQLMAGQIDEVTGRILVDVNVSGSLNILSPTGSVNSLNTAFVFTAKPTVVVNDGVTLRENLGWTWNAGTTTATMDSAPNYDLFGLI